MRVQSRAEHRRDQAAIHRRFVEGSRGVNDPLGRAWGQAARTGGGSFTPRLLHEPKQDGRQNTPPFQGAVVARNAAKVTAAH
jgi:hypothetical protein